jgi:hypothetical protein
LARQARSIAVFLGIAPVVAEVTARLKAHVLVERLGDGSDSLVLVVSGVKSRPKQFNTRSLCRRQPFGTKRVEILAEVHLTKMGRAIPRFHEVVDLVNPV